MCGKCLKHLTFSKKEKNMVSSEKFVLLCDGGFNKLRPGGTGRSLESVTKLMNESGTHSLPPNPSPEIRPPIQEPGRASPNRGKVQLMSTRAVNLWDQGCLLSPRLYLDLVLIEYAVL